MFTFRDWANSHACFLSLIRLKVIRTIEGISWIRLICRKIYAYASDVTCASDSISHLSFTRNWRVLVQPASLLLESYSTLSRIVSVEEGDGPCYALATKNGEHDWCSLAREQPFVVHHDDPVHRPDIDNLLNRGLHLQLQRLAQPGWLLVRGLELHGAMGGRMEQYGGQ